MDRLRGIYFRIGIHTAPPGTLLHLVHRCLKASYRCALRLAIVTKKHFLDEPQSTRAAPEWYRVLRPNDPWFQFREQLAPDEHVIYDLDVGIHKGKAAGIALVFFMGIGDYIFSTPLLAELRRRYPETPIYGYVSSSTDTNNSPLVGKLMEHNPDIDKVFYYQGSASALNWKNYDYKAVYDLVPKRFLVVPMLYEASAAVPHRMQTLFQTFSLPVPKVPPLPLLHLPETPGDHIVRLKNKIQKTCTKSKRTGIVFLQLDARSSDYSYPYSDKVAADLCKNGHVVISASKLTYQDSACFQLDFSQFSIADSIHLLKLLKEEFGDRLMLLTVASVFWSVSAALELRNVGLHHFLDDAIHNYWYPNIHVVTNYDYPHIPKASVSLAGKSDFTINNRGRADFKPEFALRCFYKIAQGDRVPAASIEPRQHLTVVPDQEDETAVSWRRNGA